MRFQGAFSCMNEPMKEHPWSLKVPRFHSSTCLRGETIYKTLWRVSFIHEPKKKIHPPSFSPPFFLVCRNRIRNIFHGVIFQHEQSGFCKKKTIEHWGGDFQKLDFIPEGILALGYYLWLWFVSQAVILRWMFPHDSARIFYRLCGMAFCRYEMQSSTHFRI